MARFRFGAHMPTAGGLYKAVTGGAAIGCDTVQLFTASPRQWSSAPLTTEQIRRFRRAVEATGIHPLIAHDSYLINLATQKPELLEKSRQAFLEELRRAEMLGLDFVVTHLGAHTGAGAAAGIAMLSESLSWIHQQTPNFRVQIALETTAGQGTCLGGDFDHFPEIFARVNEAERLRVCLDTCHIFVAGYDLRDAKKVQDTLRVFGEKIGFERLCCVHANDAQKDCGSHTDRHAHIGCGFVGREGFTAFLADPRLPDHLPLIVETPDADACHKINVATIRALASGADQEKPS